MKKVTITGRYFFENKPDFVQEITKPDIKVPHGRSPCRRLSWLEPFPFKCEVTVSNLVEMWKASPRDAVFFLDTNFLTTPIDEAFFRFLLDRTVIIVPGVLQELGPWLMNPKANGFIWEETRKAIEAGTGPIFFDEVDETMKGHAYDYYLGLLALRKRWGFQIARDLAESLGRQPNDLEFAAACHKHLGDRGLMIAKKGWKEAGRENYLTDEQLVVQAVLSGILSGNESYILTRDNDVLEQFYKLIFIIETHYRSMLLGDMYAKDPEKFVKIRFSDMPHLVGQDRFSGADDHFFHPGFEKPRDTDNLLPVPHRFVNLECWWFSGGPNDLQICRFGYSGEMEMARILAIKSRSEGLNTERLDGKNIHLWPFPDSEGSLPAVTTDTITQGNSGKVTVHGPTLDR